MDAYSHIGLTSTYDPLIDEKLRILNFSNLTKKKNCFHLIEKHLEEEKIKTLGGLFLV